MLVVGKKRVDINSQGAQSDIRGTDVKSILYYFLICSLVPGVGAKDIKQR